MARLRLNRYYSNEVDSHETLPLPNSIWGAKPYIIGSESEVGIVVVMFISSGHLLPHSIIRGAII